MAEVMLVRWPEEGDEGLRLAGAGVAVLYLVTGDETPRGRRRASRTGFASPATTAISAPASPRSSFEPSPTRPHHASTSRVGSTTAAIRSRSHRTKPAWHAALVRHLDAVVTDNDLSQELDEVDPGASLRTLMAQLRARLRHVDLLIRRIRRRGYMLCRR